MPAKKASNKPKKPKKRRQRQVREPLMHLPSQPNEPTHRLLRGYAFDPTLVTRLDTALVSEITYRVSWERMTSEVTLANGKTAVVSGPRGEYLEIVDYDPAARCFYAPVNLDDPRVLAENGVALAESNPQFHQQMVYAVAMTTIDRFERALGRKTLWADRRVETAGKPAGWKNIYVQRLRIYPHALRQANAYYSREKFALLFGYFPATATAGGGQFPGGMVFTCLSHDIIAHETTHALLDGFHERFLEPTNPDVLAFHEAFADIVALFQHFSFPEVLRHQIARTRGNLSGSENLLGQLASQFGLARGMHGSLRDAIGKVDPATGRWRPHVADASELGRTTEVHARGSILVAAVFDAFLSIYRARTRDLLRIASDGTGELRRGELHPDLVNRLAEEAAKASSHVLNICIRALDYCPPVDLTFGEYLRALITADMDLMTIDTHQYRVAFIEAFRRRGIYPEGLRTLGADTLRWSRPEEEPRVDPRRVGPVLAAFIRGIGLRGLVERLRYLRDRREIWDATRAIRGALHDNICNYLTGLSKRKVALLEDLIGLKNLAGTAPKAKGKAAEKFYVDAFRESRREGDDGRALNQVFITLLRTGFANPVAGGRGKKKKPYEYRAGCTFVVDLEKEVVRYVIRKGAPRGDRLTEALKFQTKAEQYSLAATYFGGGRENFARLHGMGA